MLTEYLAFGGVEIANNARAYAYSRCLECCMGLLRCNDCPGIHDATNGYTPAVWDRTDPLNPILVDPAVSDEPPYDCSVIERSPWYDPDNPFSEEFGGFYVLDISGITDSTMSAGVTEAIGDGGVVGRTRHSTRVVQIRVALVGCSRGAVEYGLAWLKVALSDNFCARHGDSCGASDLAFFIDCPPELEEGDENYDEKVAPYRRFLHGVVCTSGPLLVAQRKTRNGGYYYEVEYTLTAESPFVWGETLPLQAAGSALTAVDDIPYNLMLRPSGEESDGVPQVVATQYAFNGSAEYGGSASTLPTGWAAGSTGIGGGLTISKSTDIAAVGPNSARYRLLATGAVTDGSMALYYDVPLAGLPGGAKPSVSLWGAALTFAGSPVVGELGGEVEWLNGGSSLGETDLGTIPVDGGNLIATGLTIPATATTARLWIVAQHITASASDDLRVYADAFSLTVP